MLTATHLENKAISTSGISRKYYLNENGNKHSHITNPKTGHSIENNLLTVTVKDSLAVELMYSQRLSR
jgi:FAD:protein FMN transferase